MNLRRFAVGLALTVTAVLVLAGDGRTQQLVPFKGVVQATHTVTPVIPPFIVDVRLTGAGNATQLGAYTLVFVHRVDRSTVPTTAAGTMTFTAANGDTLIAQVIGKGTPTAVPGIIYVVETCTITGGTGRFVGASGNFICGRLVDTINLKSTGSFQGVIATP